MLIKKKIIVKLTSIPLSKNLLHLLKIQAFPIYSFCWIAHFHLVAESSISIISISKIPINATIPNPFSQNLCKPNQTMETLISQNFQPQNHLNFHRKFKHIYMQYPQNPMPPQIKNSNFFFFFKNPQTTTIKPMYHRLQNVKINSEPQFPSFFRELNITKRKR